MKKRITTLLWIIILLFSMTCAHAADPQQPQVVLAFVGDILLADNLGKLIESRGPDYPWAQVATILREADFVVGNLECAVATTGTPQAGKQFTFRAKPEALTGLVNAGVDLVSLANNHTLDYGAEALLETMSWLDHYGLAHVGAGRDFEEASRVKIVEINGISFGFIGTSQVVPAGWAATRDRAGVFSGHDMEALLGRVRQTSPQVDYTVVLIHWGVEREDAPRSWQVGVAKRLFDAGANLIIGHHPHVLQGIGLEPGRLVAYSLGNFIFTTRPDSPRNQETGILLVTLSKERIEEVRLVPALIYWGQTRLEGAPRESILVRLDRLSEPFDTEVDLEGWVRRVEFSDVRGHWASRHVGRLKDKGIVTGYPGGRFVPDAPITRAELLTMLGRAAGLQPGAQGDHWASALFSTALDIGAIDLQYYPEGFILDEPASRWEMAVMAVRLLDRLGVMAKREPHLFPDLVGWPKGGQDILMAFQMGILEGYPDGTIRPADRVTRAEASTVACRILDTMDDR